MTASAGTFVLAHTGSGTSLSSGSIGTTTVHDVLLATTIDGNSGGDPTGSDSLSNTGWAQLGTAQVETTTGSRKTDLYTQDIANAGAGHTISVNYGSANNISLLAGYVTGTAGAGAVDAGSLAQTIDTATAYQVTSGVPAQTDNYWWSSYGVPDAGPGTETFTQPPGWALLQKSDDRNTSYCGAVGGLAIVSGSAQSITWADSQTTGDRSLKIVAIKSLVAAGPLEALPKRLVFRRARESSTFDWTAAGWFNSQALTSGIFDRDLAYPASAGGGLTSSLASTEESDAAASAVFVLLAAILASSEAGDSLASAATAALVASDASTEQGDSLAGASGVVVNAALSATEADDGLSGASLAVIGLSLASTEDGDASSAAALVTVGAATASVEEGDSAASSSVALISATLATTEDAESLASTAAGAIAASLTATEDGDALAAAAAGPGALTAELSATESHDALSGAATGSIAASLASAESDDALNATAEQLATYALTSTEENDGLTGVSSATATATLSGTEENESLAGALTAALAANLSATEGPDGLASTVAIALMAALDSIEANDILASSAYSDGSIAAVWEYVLSNGKTAEQNVVEIRTMLDTVLDNAPIEGSLTAGELLRLIAAVQAGKSTIVSEAPGTAHVEFTAVDGTDIRVAADMDGSERTDVTVTL